MTTLEWITGALLAVLMLLSAFGHLFNPKFTDPFIPDFFPKKLVHWATAAVEITLAVCIFMPIYRTWALQGTIVLMLLLLPVHLRDLFLEKPAIGSRKAAWIRLPFQFLFMAMAWYAIA
jgi:uncharacterized membrane protein